MTPPIASGNNITSNDFIKSSKGGKKDVQLKSSCTSTFVVESPTPSILLSSPERAKSRARTRDDQIRRTAELKLSKNAKNNSMNHQVVFMDRQATILEACQMMAARRVDAILVTEGGQPTDPLKGILTDKDIVFKCIGMQLDPSQVKVSSIMTHEPMTLKATEPMSDGLALMLTGHFRHLPLVEEICENGEENSKQRVTGLLDITKCMKDALIKLRKRDALAKQLGIAQNESSVKYESGKLEDEEDEKLNEVVKMAQQLHRQLQIPRLDSVVSASGGHDSARGISYQSTVMDAVYWMKAHKQTAVLLFPPQETATNNSSSYLTANELSGIFTTKDVVLRVIAAHLDPKSTSLVRVMTPHPDKISSEESILTALEMMFEKRYLHLPVQFGRKFKTQLDYSLVDVLSLTFKMMEKIQSDLVTPSLQVTSSSSTDAFRTWLYQSSHVPRIDSYSESSTLATTNVHHSMVDGTPILSKGYLSSNSLVDNPFMTTPKVLHDFSRLERDDEDALSHYSLNTTFPIHQPCRQDVQFICKIKINSKESICLPLKQQPRNFSDSTQSSHVISFSYADLRTEIHGKILSKILPLLEREPIATGNDTEIEFIRATPLDARVRLCYKDPEEGDQIILQNDQDLTLAYQCLIRSTAANTSSLNSKLSLMVFIDDLLLEDFLAMKSFSSLESITNRCMSKLTSASLEDLPLTISPWIKTGFSVVVLLSLAIPIYKKLTSS